MTTVVTEVRNTNSTCRVFMGRRSGKMARRDGGQEVISRERKKQINGYTHGVGRWRGGSVIDAGSSRSADLIYEGTRCRRPTLARPLYVSPAPATRARHIRKRHNGN